MSRAKSLKLSAESTGSIRALRHVTRTLLVTKGVATRSKGATSGAPGITTRSKKLQQLLVTNYRS